MDYRPSLINVPINFYSCFISYSEKKRDFARRLHEDLLNEGVRCWFSPEDLKIGDKMRPAFDRAIRIHDKLLLILSENSIGSEWVKKEVELAGKELSVEKLGELIVDGIQEGMMDGSIKEIDCSPTFPESQ
ncbi:toll/interleukin-1 receptor domain-containing protein [Patescibacteria group bacterium]|nr:toll/interleukin-1 receptor domain-containing protein [Patescibacteria group bacterium]